MAIRGLYQSAGETRTYVNNVLLYNLVVAGKIVSNISYNT